MAIYRVDDGARRVLLLDDPDADADVNPSDNTSAPKQPTSTVDPPATRAEPTKSRTSNPTKPKTSMTTTTTNKSSCIPSTESDAPDVTLHVDGCAVAVHLSVLQLRCPWLYKQLRLLRHTSLAKDGAVTLRLLDEQDLQQLEDAQEDICKCPLEDFEALRLDFVRCAVHRRGGRSCSEQDSPEIVQKRKRLRQDPLAAVITGPPSGHKVARSLFSDDEGLTPMALSRLEKEVGVMHVEIEGTNLGALVTAVEYIYRFKVRMIDTRNAMEAVKLGQWLGMRKTMLYYCLVLAIRHVDTTSWMEMLLAASALDDNVMRHILCDLLVAFIKSLKPDQYYQVLTDMRTVYISRLKHRDILIQAVVGLINSVRLLEFWRNLLDAVSKWLCYNFQASELLSLRDIHTHFAPEWEPYIEREPVEIEVMSGEGNLFTLLQFGKFQLQVRIDITDEMPIMWRIIRSSSPQLLTAEADKLDEPEALKKDPEFWIRGQMKVKYLRAQPNHAEVSQEVTLEYQHCYQQYSKWCDLVPPSPSSLTPAVAATFAIQPEAVGKAQFRGKFFVWGNPVCSMYHFLLQTTIFYSAPHGASTELSDLMVVSEMQRLPLDTLVLVLRSDRLRIPEGERTLLRCLNKLVFGNNFSYLGSSNQAAHDYNGNAKDVLRLYKCVRWCFVPMDDIIGTLRRSPRELKFYELIEKGIQDTFRRFLRRRPWGWRKYRPAYMKSESNVVEFRIEAGDSRLSPEYFPQVPAAGSSSQDSLLSIPTAVYWDPPHVQGSSAALN
ncbi:hypothetical protein KRP22_008695 [Phytophthora ramorum]|uniref:uncharacterized protein n=1 Tax=Phytophthora ramorum TaxID=164328 RepID=UPI00309CEA41|nr:hypothetical protein KRP23_2614 [Phytophthora ramorum]KAH7502053.1 hypothetical protein KRP22_7527 [Phytophthora ramorum]